MILAYHVCVLHNSSVHAQRGFEQSIVLASLLTSKNIGKSFQHVIQIYSLSITLPCATIYNERSWTFTV